jgi:hypothetical protein
VFGKKKPLRLMKNPNQLNQWPREVALLINAAIDRIRSIRSIKRELVAMTFDYSTTRSWKDWNESASTWSDGDYKMPILPEFLNSLMG